MSPSRAIILSKYAVFLFTLADASKIFSYFFSKTKEIKPIRMSVFELLVDCLAGQGMFCPRGTLIHIIQEHWHDSKNKNTICYGILEKLKLTERDKRILTKLEEFTNGKDNIAFKQFINWEENERTLNKLSQKLTDFICSIIKKKSNFVACYFDNGKNNNVRMSLLFRVDDKYLLRIGLDEITYYFPHDSQYYQHRSEVIYRIKTTYLVNVNDYRFAKVWKFIHY